MRNITRDPNLPHKKRNRVYKAKRSALELAKLIDEYIRIAKETSGTITITGFLVYADISKDTLVNYEQKPTYVSCIKKLRLEAENYLQQKLLLENKPIGAIFLLKSKYGYIEQQKLDITSDGKTLGVIQLPTRNPS